MAPELVAVRAAALAIMRIQAVWREAVAHRRAERLRGSELSLSPSELLTIETRLELVRLLGIRHWRHLLRALQAAVRRRRVRRLAALRLVRVGLAASACGWHASAAVRSARDLAASEGHCGAKASRGNRSAVSGTACYRQEAVDRGQA